MCPDWLESIRSAVPRGFSRYYVMDVLQEGPHTGKEIIKRAEEESDGRWSPSPGLIYPLLGRLHEEGMIAEVGDNSDGSVGDDKTSKRNAQYRITPTGTRTIEDIRKISDGMQKQMEVMGRLGGAGRFVAADIVERVASACAAMTQGTIADTAQYRQFLEDEIERLDSMNGARVQTGHDNSKDEGDIHYHDDNDDDYTGTLTIDVK